MADDTDLNDDGLPEGEEGQELEISLHDPASEEGGSSTDAADANIPDDTGGEEEQIPAWRLAWEEAGFENVETPDDAITRAVKTFQSQQEQIQTLADQVRFYQDQQRFAPKEHTSSGALPQEPTSQEDQANELDRLIKGWEDPSWAEKYVVVDENGITRIKDDVDDMTRNRLIEVDRSVRQWQDIVNDPRKLIQAIDDRVNKMVAEQIDSGWEARSSEMQERSTVDRWMDENANWIYETDPTTGRVVQDPVTRKPKWSREGMEFLGYMDEAAQDGVSSTARQIAYAERALGFSRYRRESEPTNRRERVANTVEQRRAEMRGRRNSGKKTQRTFNGVSPERAGDVTGADDLGFVQETLELMKANAS